jgi:heat shock protein HslJ
MRSILIAISALVLLTLSGCGSTTDPVGSWGREGQGQPSLKLAKDGKVTGSDGCNRLISSWKQDGDQIKFDIVAGTMMHCEGVDTWLSAMKSATVKNDVMTIKDDSGEKIGELKRESK